MECQLCKAIERKERVVYEDTAVVALAPEQPTVLGHIMVLPKQHVENIDELPEEVAVQLNFVVSYAASAIFEAAGAQGTNIIALNGKIQGKKYAHFAFDILPRKENDDLNFQWKPKQMQPQDLDGIYKSLKDKADYINAKQEKPKPAAHTEEQIKPPMEKQANSDDEEDYMIKQLTRIP